MLRDGWRKCKQTYIRMYVCANIEAYKYARMQMLHEMSVPTYTNTYIYISYAILLLNIYMCVCVCSNLKVMPPRSGRNEQIIKDRFNVKNGHVARNKKAGAFKHFKALKLKSMPSFIFQVKIKS